MDPVGEPSHPDLAVDVRFENERLCVELADGRTVSVPVEVHPALAYGSDSARENWRLVDDGAAIQWPELDAEVATDKLVAGTLPPHRRPG